jgi:hypothetical protein
MGNELPTPQPNDQDLEVGKMTWNRDKNSWEVKAVK